MITENSGLFCTKIIQYSILFNLFSLLNNLKILSFSILFYHYLIVHPRSFQTKLINNT